MQRLSYLRRVAVAADIFANSCTPGGRTDMTLSTRACLCQYDWPWSWLYWALTAIAPGHCRQALENDFGRALAAADYLHKHNGEYGYGGNKQKDQDPASG
jgi:hypothetical protein